MLDSRHRWAIALMALSLAAPLSLVLLARAAQEGTPEVAEATTEEIAQETTEEVTEKTTQEAAEIAPDQQNPAATSDNPLYDLHYQFKPGEVVRWEVVHRASVDTTIQGTNQTAETRSISVKAWKITDVSAEGVVALVHSVESIDMWQKMQGRQEVRYNSRTDATVPPGYEDVAKAVGVPLTVLSIDSRGKVLSREEKHPQSNVNASPITMPLPTEPVAVGYTWSVPIDVDVVLHGGGSKKISTRQQFTLAKVVDGLATIEVDMEVVEPLNDPAIEAQLIQRLTRGALKFDIDRGRVISQQLDLDRRVIGFSGAASSMHYLTRFTEELMPAKTPVASTAKKARPVAKKPAAPKAPATANAPATLNPPATATKKATLKQPALR